MKNQSYAELYDAYCQVRNHLLVLSRVVEEGNQSASLQFALQSKGIVDSLEAPRTKYPTFACPECGFYFFAEEDAEKCCMD